MALDLAKLSNVKRHPNGKITARCPACAESGGDSQGVHLVMYTDGKFGCVVYPKDHAHRQEIFRLVGQPEAEKGKPKPIAIRTTERTLMSEGVVLTGLTRPNPITRTEEYSTPGRLGRHFPTPLYQEKRTEEVSYIEGEVENTRPRRPDLPAKGKSLSEQVKEQRWAELSAPKPVVRQFNQRDYATQLEAARAFVRMRVPDDGSNVANQ
jgi:hypothetical protein